MNPGRGGHRGSTDTEGHHHLHQGRGHRGRGPAVHGLPGPVAALLGARHGSSPRTCSSSGLGFDGSSIRGWQAINESDMLVMPVPETAFVDPFLAAQDAGDDLQHLRPDHGRGLHPRPAQHRPQGRGLPARHAASPTPPTSGPRRSSSSSTTSATTRTSTRATTTSTRSRAGGTRAATRTRTSATRSATRRATSPSRPTDTLQDIRSEMMLTLECIGIPIEAQHHEVATGGQCEIDMRFGSLVQMADNVLKYKYVVKNVAQQARQDRRPSCPSRCSATTAAACTCTSRCGRAARTSSPATATRA